MALARSSFSSDDEVTMTRAPASLANCSAKIETPPVPCTSTVSPAVSLPSTISPRQAVTAAQGSVAASSALQPAGALVTPSAVSAIASQATPSSAPPSAASRCGVGRPAVQCGKKPGITRSPAFTRVTPSPTCSTTPAPSESGISGRCGAIMVTVARSR